MVTVRLSEWPSAAESLSVAVAFVLAALRSAALSFADSVTTAEATGVAVAACVALVEAVFVLVAAPAPMPLSTGHGSRPAPSPHGSRPRADAEPAISRAATAPSKRAYFNSRDKFRFLSREGREEAGV